MSSTRAQPTTTGGETMATSINLEAFLPKDVRVRLIKTGSTCRLDDMHQNTLAYDLPFNMDVPFLQGTLSFNGQDITFNSDVITTAVVYIHDEKQKHAIYSGSTFFFDLIVGH